MTGAWDASAAATSKPAKTGAVLPAVCGVGEQFFLTAATPGNNLFLCSAANTWTVAGVVAANQRIRAVGYTFDGGGAALTAGATKYLTVPFACTIGAWNIVVDTGTASVKTWKAATGTAIPTAANSISTSGVSISSGTAIHSTVLADFTSTAVAANDVIGFNLSAVAGAPYVNFILECTQ